MNSSPAAALTVQSVLYNTEQTRLMRVLEALDASARHAGIGLKVALGDCSAQPVVGDDDLSKLRESLSSGDRLEYTFFGANLGHSRGQNRLSENLDTEFVMFLNPDAIVAPNLIADLLSAFDRPDVGIAEARQLPIEHPKEYDPVTDETPWAAGACLMIRSELFRHLGGFDADTFYMYCDDVDLCWRSRLAGYTVLFRPSAAVFHPKRLTKDATTLPTGTELGNSPEAYLLLAHKFSRPDVVERGLTEFKRGRDPLRKKAAAAFLERREKGTLPEPIDPDHKVAQFEGYAYARHRFVL